MGIPVLVIGKSGSGKSTSLRNFEDDELYLINVIGKSLPFPKKFSSTFVTDEYNNVYAAMVKTPKKAIVIDDAGYLITDMFMKSHSAKGGGSAVFDLYNNIADKFWQLVTSVVTNLPEDKIVYFMMHEDKNDFGEVKPKTIGKLLDEKVCLEGMFTIVLRCLTDNGKHIFRTKTKGDDVTKTPIGLFEEEEIDNDLALVDHTIRSYYGMNDKKEKEKK